MPFRKGVEQVGKFGGTVVLDSQRAAQPDEAGMGAQPGEPETEGVSSRGSALVQLQDLGIRVPVGLVQSPRQRIAPEVVGERVAALAQAGQLLAPLPGLLRDVVSGLCRRLVVHCLVLDCWRVLAVEPPHRLTLEAEMRLPGRAWLQFEVDRTSKGVRIRQTALFDPVGLTGRLYWYLLFPPHQLIFRGMLHGVAARALATPAAAPPPASAVPV